MFGTEALEGPEFEDLIKVPTDDEQLTLKLQKTNDKYLKFNAVQLTFNLPGRQCTDTWSNRC